MKAKSDKSYYRYAREDVFALVPTGVRRVLEIGCGAGRFRTNCPADVEYWGVEPVAEAAREAVGLTRVLVGTLDEVAASLPDGYFDLVVCNWVLLDLLFRRDWRYRESGVLDSTHLRFFTFKSARRLLTEGGFEIEVFRGRAVGDIWWAKALLVLLAPVICLVGWDVCRTQMLFRARKGLVG